MKNLQEATERICELKGNLIALDALVLALIEALPASARATLPASFEVRAEVARTILLNADISDIVLVAFERDVARHRAAIQYDSTPAAAGPNGVERGTRMSGPKTPALGDPQLASVEVLVDIEGPPIPVHCGLSQLRRRLIVLGIFKGHSADPFGGCPGGPELTGRFMVPTVD